MNKKLMKKSSCIVRPEQMSDYHAVAEIDTEAFTYAPYVSESMLTAALRRRKAFDPELSLVAEIEGTVAGHILFSPCTLRMGGSNIPAVLLAPLAIKPEYQGIGVGSTLIRIGTEILKSKGYALSILLGHSDYYPRFGYLTRAFGKSYAQLNLTDLPSMSSALTERKVKSDDIPALQLLWDKWYGCSDLVLKPDETITEWISVNRLFRSSAVWRNEELIGYVRYAVDNPSQVLMFMSADLSATADILAYLGELAATAGKNSLEISLPMNDNKESDTVLPYMHEWKIELWDAAMVHILDESSSYLQTYFDRVRNNEEKPGPLIWPVEFEA